MQEEPRYSRRSVLASTLGLGLGTTGLFGCGGGSSSSGGTVTAQQAPSGQLPPTTPCGAGTALSCDGRYHLGIHSSGGVELGLTYEWSEQRTLGSDIGITRGAMVLPGQAYAFKALPANARLWLRLNGQPIPDAGTLNLDLSPTADNVLYAYVAIMPGDPAPEFKGADANGSVHRLSDRRGKWTVVCFAWECAGARNFAPELAKWYSQYHAAGLEALFVHWRWGSDRLATPADLNDWAQTNGCNYPVISDDDWACQWYDREYLSCNDYSCSGVPAIFLIDPQGTIANRYVGWNPEDGLAAVLASRYA